MAVDFRHDDFPQAGLAVPIESSQNQPSAVLTVEKLALKLAGKEILQQVNFSLPAIGVTSVIGPSGAGKSSLLRCLNGSRRPYLLCARGLV